MTVDLSSPESETGSTDSGTWGGDEGMCELSQGRGVRRGPNPDRQRCKEYVRALVHRDSIPAHKYYTTFVGVLPEQWYRTFGSTPRPVKN